MLREADVVRAVQEGYFPEWFNNFMVKALFNDRNAVYFTTFLGFYWSIRVFLHYNEGYSMTYDDFKGLLSSGTIPERLKYYTSRVYVPT